MGGLVHVQDVAVLRVDDEQAVVTGIGQVEYQLQAFTAVAQHLLDLCALLEFFAQAPVAGLQGAGAPRVAQRQANGRDQQQAGEQAGAEDDLR
ncbi:hypothetical protein D3C80_1387900 [compost metagenome]